MKIYLDTGNIEEIRDAAKSGLLDGVTTNPTLIAKEGRDFKQTLKEITKILGKHSSGYTLSAEVTNTKNSADIIKEARVLSKINPHILVKIPLTKQGIEAVSTLSREDIRCNVTLCFSANQAILAAKAGAWCVSPFIGRIDDEGYDGMEVVREIREIYDNYNFKTKILGASIRSANHVLECARAGVDIITIPHKIYSLMYYNPLTDIGLEKFEHDWLDYQREMHK